MRTEKYNPEECGDDIKFAFEHNGLSEYLPKIDVIIAEVCGVNDEYAWYWILQMKDGTYRYATGSCDYTGWDCQSSASISEPFNYVQQAVDTAPENDYSNRRIRSTLNKQITGELPFALYQNYD